MHGTKVRKAVPLPQFCDYVRAQVASPDVRTVCEVGMNAGFFAELVLSVRPDVNMVSFDPMANGDVSLFAKAYLDRRFPCRHMVVAGDPVEGLASFLAMYKGRMFDLVLVDISRPADYLLRLFADLRPICSSRCLLVANNLTPYKPESEGPTDGFVRAVKCGQLVEQGYYHDPQVHNVWAEAKMGTGAVEGAGGGAVEVPSRLEAFVKSNKLIKLYKYGRELDAAKSGALATEIWQNMLKEGVEPDSWAYNSVLKWLKRDVPPNLALMSQLRQEMQARGFVEMTR